MIQSLETPLGTMLARWTAKGLYSFTFARDEGIGSNLSDSAASQITTPMLELSEAIEDYFDRGIFNWPLRQLDWTRVTPFNQALLKACYAIAPGKTKTYGELAALCGSPRAARAAGQAMAKNRWPIIIPCHRVVGSRGKLTGYSGAGGLQTKQRLLRLEAGESLTITLQ